MKHLPTAAAGGLLAANPAAQVASRSRPSGRPARATPTCSSMTTSRRREVRLRRDVGRRLLGYRCEDRRREPDRQRPRDLDRVRIDPHKRAVGQVGHPHGALRHHETPRLEPHAGARQHPSRPEVDLVDLPRPLLGFPRKDPSDPVVNGDGLPVPVGVIPSRADREQDGA